MSAQADGSFGPFELLDCIGRGASGEVWRAAETGTGRIVALKVLAAETGAADPERAAHLAWRFQREIEAAAQLEHPHIARIFSNGGSRGRPWYAMEFIAGPPIDVHCERHGLDLRARLGLFRSVCDGVQHAHDRGIIHRDLKPANILVTADGTPKLLDFGLARFLEDSGLGLTLSCDGQMLGTPMFMAPEQAAGRLREVGVAADVYALGVILYRLADGGWPYDDALPPLQLLAAARDTEQRPPRGLPRDLTAIVEKAMAREKADRYPSARAFAEDIAHYLAGEPVTARRATLGYLLRRRLRKHWRATAAGVAFLALITGFAFTFVQQRHRAAERNARALDQARDVVNVMLFDLHAKLAAIGRSDIYSDTVARAASLPWPVDENSSGELDMLRSRALTAMARGDHFLGNANPANALEAYREASNLLKTLEQRQPAPVRLRIDAASATLAVHKTLFILKQPDAALRGAREVLQSVEALANGEPGPEIAALCAEAHRTAGAALLALARFSEAEAEFRKALPILDAMARDRAAQLDAQIHEDLGEALRNLAKPGEALTALAEAERRYRAWRLQHPTHGLGATNLARCLATQLLALPDLGGRATHEQLRRYAADYLAGFDRLPNSTPAQSATARELRDHLAQEMERTPSPALPSPQ